MGIVVLDVFNVEVRDYYSGKHLFTVDTALDSHLSFANNGNEGSLLLNQCYFNSELFESAMNGDFENRRLQLIIKGKVKDSETGQEGILEISAYNAEINDVSIGSNKNRIMTNDILFIVHKRNNEGQRCLFINTKMDDGSNE